jgi:hypothetical protein
MNKLQIVRTAAIKIAPIFNPNKMEPLRIIILRKLVRETTSFILMLLLSIIIKAITSNR